MVSDLNIKPWGLVIQRITYPHRPNVLLTVVFTGVSLAVSVVWEQNNFTKYGKINFLVTCHLLELTTFADQKMHANPIRLWFLSYLGGLL